MKGVMRSAAVGGLLALIVVIAAVGYFVYQNRDAATDSDRILVVIVSPSDTKGDVAVAAIEVDQARGESRVLDVLAPATVSGTSASNAFEAFAYGGGDAVAEALAGQTDGELPWIVIQDIVWDDLIDEADGMVMNLSHAVNVYAETTLTVFPEGKSTLDGDAATAFVRSIEYLEEDVRSDTVTAFGRGFLEALRDSDVDLAVLVGEEGVDASRATDSLEQLIVR